MTPRSFLDGLNGSLLQPMERKERLKVPYGGTLGVVLMGLGGPSSPGDIEGYLYRLLMDPLRVRLRWMPRWAREWVARLLARRRAAGLEEALLAVGGVAPEIRLISEQARALETALKRRFETGAGLSCRAYAALRYGNAEQIVDTIRRMREDGVTHVVLVPTSPVRLTAVTDTCVAWWQMMAREAEFDHVPVAVVDAHGQRATFVQATSDRIDEAIQRFPRPLRDDVHLIYALHPAAALDAPDGTPEHTPLAGLIEQISGIRGEKRPKHLAYVQNWGLSRQPSPVMVEMLEVVAQAGGTGAVVVPVGFTSETMETAYELDVALRRVAEAHELQQIEIASGLNCHALYIRTLEEAVRDRIYLPVGQGDGMPLPIPATSDVVRADDDAV